MKWLYIALVSTLFVLFTPHATPYSMLDFFRHIAGLVAIICWFYIGCRWIVIINKIPDERE